MPPNEGYVLDTLALGSVRPSLDAGTVDAYLAQIGDGPLRAGDHVPSSFLAKMYADVMRANFTRGPSLHVSTRVQHFRPVEVGEELTVRARVDRLYGRRGGRYYYVLDMAWVDTEDHVAMTAEHTGIYHVRRARG